MNTKITQNIKSIILALALVLGVGYVQAAWTTAPSNPPFENTPAPINVGGVMGVLADKQTKTGDLTLNGILTSLHLFTPDLTITNSDGTTANIESGSVLVADGNNTGKVKWGDPVPGTTGEIPVNISELDPIVCNASGMVSDGGITSFAFSFSGPPQVSSPFSTSNCYYASDIQKLDRVNIGPLVTLGAYVGVLKGVNASISLANATPVLVDASISGAGGNFHTSTPGNAVNVSAVYVPTGLVRSR